MHQASALGSIRSDADESIGVRVGAELRQAGPAGRMAIEDEERLARVTDAVGASLVLEMELHRGYLGRGILTDLIVVGSGGDAIVVTVQTVRVAGAAWMQPPA